MLSPSTRRFDFVRKAEEYKRLPTLKHFVLLDPEVAKVWLWTRGDDGDWRDEHVSGLDQGLPLRSLDVDLPMVDIYEGVRLTP